GRHVVGAEYRLAWSYEIRRAAMAVHAPGHLQGLLLPHQRHAVDLTVACRAPDAFRDMDAVVEIHEVRKIVDARPGDRSACAETCADRLEERTGGERL